MKVRYEITKSNAARARREKYGHVVVDVPLARLSDEQIELLVTKYGSPPGCGRDEGPRADWYLEPSPYSDYPKEVREVLLGAREESTDACVELIEKALDAWNSYRARVAEREEQERRERADKTLAVVRGRMTRPEREWVYSDEAVKGYEWVVTRIAWPHNYDEDVYQSAEAKAFRDEIDDLNRKAQAEARAEAIKLKEALKSRDAEQQRRANFGREKLREWALKYGDETLRLRLEGDYAWVELARQQFLEAVVAKVAFPYARGAAEGEVEASVVSPSLAAMKAEAALKGRIEELGIDAECCLVTVTEEDEEEDPSSWVEIQLMVVCPDGELCDYYFSPLKPLPPEEPDF